MFPTLVCYQPVWHTCVAARAHAGDKWKLTQDFHTHAACRIPESTWRTEELMICVARRADEMGLVEEDARDLSA
jgi:hypothetical protein